MKKFVRFSVYSAIVLVLLLFFVITVGCDKEQQRKVVTGPFRTSEWKDCFEECRESLPKNLKLAEFSESEIGNLNPDSICVQFCTKALYRRRNIK